MENMSQEFCVVPYHDLFVTQLDGKVVPFNGHVTENIIVRVNSTLHFTRAMDGYSNNEP